MKVAINQQEQETLTCAICGKTVKSIQGLRVHKGLSHKEKPAEETPAPAIQVAPAIQSIPEIVQDPPELEPNLTDPVLTIHAPAADPVEAEPLSEIQGEVVDAQLDPAYGEGNIQIDPATVAIAPPNVIEEPEPVEMPLNPVELGIDEIIIGSLLRLQGLHYVFNEQTIKGPELADGILVKVNFRWEDQGHKKFYLRAKSEVGSQEWIVSEEDVLNSNNVQLISLGEKQAPENYMPEVPAPLEEVDEGPSEEELEKQAKFLRAVDKYIQARDAKLEAEKIFKTADKSLRPVILEYLESCGAESDEGKGDKLLQLEDFKVHWTFTPGEDYIKKDENKILDFLKSNVYLAALDYKVNWEVWDKLKENGTIPPQFVTEVEQPAKSKDARKLLVEKLQLKT